MRLPYWAACVKHEKFFLSRWRVFSLTERTEVTEVLSARFRAHKIVAPPPTPPPQGGA